MRYRIQPLTDFTIFTTPASERRPNPFRSSYDETLRLLRTEVELLGGDEIVFELGCNASDIRQDGALRARAEVQHPGVRISFESTHGALTYATDTFAGRWYGDPPDWQINLRAIALSLEALRKVDRYGVVKRGEQYVGFKALPAGRAMPSSHMTRDDALRILAGDIPLEHFNTTPESLRHSWRSARRAAHPDRNRGDQTRWDQVEQAARVLGVTA